MDLEFKAFQKYGKGFWVSWLLVGIKEVELDEANSKLSQIKQQCIEQSEFEINDRVEQIRQNLELQFEAKQLGRHLPNELIS